MRSFQFSRQTFHNVVGILTNKANIIIRYYLIPYRLSTDPKTRDLE